MTIILASIPAGRDFLSANLFLQAAEPFSVSNTTILIIVILVLLLLTAITAGAETAFFSLSSKDVDYLKTKEKPSARQALQLLDQPKMLLASILVSNNFINLAIIITTSVLLRQFISPEMPVALAFLTQILVIVFLLVLFGEVLPKVYAVQNNLKMVLFAAPVIKIIARIFSPLTRMLVSSTSFFEEKIYPETSSFFNNADFEQAIELTVGHTATREEVNIFRGIMKFGNITVRQIMRTRLDVFGIPYETDYKGLKKMAMEQGYSRMPVYVKNLDTIKGMIHTKDFLLAAGSGDFDWHSLIRPAYFVPEGKLIDDLLKEFQNKRIHFAIVVDEFGGTSGIVTLEDIMEQIIGDIKDEFDEEDVSYQKLDDYNYIFEGKTLINDMCRIISEPPETFKKVRGESDSVAGLVLEISGRFPALNETVYFKNFEFAVLELDRMRIKKVKLTITDPLEMDRAGLRVED